MKRLQKQDIQTRRIATIFLRYGFILIIALIFSYSEFFYKILLLLTIYPVKFLLSFFYEASISGNTILINYLAIEIIPACVAVSAYLLLLILNITTPMNIKKRVISLIFSISCLLIINILRIFGFSFLFINNYAYYDALHKLFWYALSILIVIGIWFASVFLFKISSIPAYSDISFLLGLIRHQKNPFYLRRVFRIQKTM